MKEMALKIIREHLEREKIIILKIIIFGSRSRGDYNANSDWDFLVLIDNDIDIELKHRLVIEIKRELAKLKIPNDIIIKPERVFNEMKLYAGNISYYANLEGVYL